MSGNQNNAIWKENEKCPLEMDERYKVHPCSEETQNVDSVALGAIEASIQCTFSIAYKQTRKFFCMMRAIAGPPCHAALVLANLSLV